MKKKSVLMYSSVKTKKMFSIQSYYKNDIKILRELGYDVHLSKSCWDYACFWRYSIAFIYFYRYGFFAALWAKIFWKKVYFTGGIDYLEPTFATPRQRIIQAIFFRLCNALSDTSFLVSSNDSKNVSRLYHGGKLPTNCKLCFHIVDFENFMYTSDIKKNMNQFLLVAWMQNIDNVFRKGIDKALMVFKIINDKHPESKFILAGAPGKGSQYITNMISELHLEDSVTYLGSISEEHKIRLMKETGFYFMLSTYEGFGIAAIETLAAGCCLIHSGNGGLSDAAGDMGVKVDISDITAIANICLEMYGKPADLKKIKDGIDFVKSRFCYSSRLNTIKKYIDTDN